MTCRSACVCDQGCLVATCLHLLAHRYNVLRPLLAALPVTLIPGSRIVTVTYN